MLYAPRQDLVSTGMRLGQTIWIVVTLTETGESAGPGAGSRSVDVPVQHILLIERPQLALACNCPIGFCNSSCVVHASCFLFLHCNSVHSHSELVLYNTSPLCTKRWQLLCGFVSRLQQHCLCSSKTQQKELWV